MRRHSFSPRVLPLIVLALIALAACTAQAPTPDPFVVADLFATPGKALATIELSATPVPTATIPNMPSPTPAPTLPLPSAGAPQPTLPIATFGPLPTRTPQPGVVPSTVFAGQVNCPGMPPMPFTPVWQNIPQAQGLMRCPVGDVQQMAGVWQNFEHGWMFWRDSDRSIFVVSELKIRQGQGSDNWWRADDTWRDGDPESDPSLSPPGGLRQPIRGFGKVWRENGFLREALGWATSEEISATLFMQQFEGGWMMTGPDGSRVYVMVPNDAPPYSSGTHLGPMP